MPLSRPSRARVGALLLVAASAAACGGQAAPAPETFGGRPRAEWIFDRDVFLTVTDPVVVPAARASRFRDDEPVIGVTVGESARAYPVSVVAYHHVVNDVLGGRPIAVTYCILCSSGVVFDPAMEGMRLTFGVDGAWRGTATLYDHQTESVWMQVTGRCVAGTFDGRALRPLRTFRHTTWGEWRTTHPQTDLMLPVPPERGGPHPEAYDTGGTSAVGSPFVPDDVRPTMPPVAAGDPLGPHDMVHGLLTDGGVRAYVDAELARARVVEERVGTVDATVWYHPPSAAVVAFDRRLGDRLLGFTVDEHGVVRDAETRSRWSLDGVATEGPLAGERLEPLLALRAEWYGWSAHHPRATLWRHDVPGAN